MQSNLVVFVEEEKTHFSFNVSYFMSLKFRHQFIKRRNVFSKANLSRLRDFLYIADKLELELQTTTRLSLIRQQLAEVAARQSHLKFEKSFRQFIVGNKDKR